MKISKEITKEFVNTVTLITLEARKEMISKKAYELAENHGFRTSGPLHDWLEAEAIVNRIYGKAE